MRAQHCRRRRTSGSFTTAVAREAAVKRCERSGYVAATMTVIRRCRRNGRDERGRIRRTRLLSRVRLRRHYFRSSAWRSTTRPAAVQERWAGILSWVVRSRHLQVVLAWVSGHVGSKRGGRSGCAVFRGCRTDTQGTSRRKTVGRRYHYTLHFNKGTVAVGFKCKANEAVAFRDASDGIGHHFGRLGRVEGGRSDVRARLVDALRLLSMDECRCKKGGWEARPEVAGIEQPDRLRADQG